MLNNGDLEEGTRVWDRIKSALMLARGAIEHSVVYVRCPSHRRQ